MQSHYDILGIDQSASSDDIKRAYRDACIKYHPDKNPGNPQAEESFKKASEAYRTLSDPGRRRMYDLGQRIDIDIDLDPTKINVEDAVETFSQILKDFVGEDKIRTFNDAAEKYEKYQKSKKKKRKKSNNPKSKRPGNMMKNKCMACGGLGYNVVKQGKVGIKRPCKKCAKTW